METITKIGALIVTLALISYTVFVILARKKVIKPGVLTFLTIGIALDITATACMIVGSTNSPFTLHGFIGYTGLLAMLIDTVLLWRNYAKNGNGATIKKALHLYSLTAYFIWVAVYITGSLLVMM